MIMNKTLLTAISVLLSVFLCNLSRAQAVISYDMIQSNRVFRLTAEVADSVTNEPVAFASVYMKHVKDTVITNFALTGPDGKVRMDDVTKGEYEFYVEFMGYLPYHKVVYVRKDVDLKKILLKPDVTALKEAKVTAKVDPVEFRNDTIVYNAAAFRTLSNGKLVDLLKQMPGVEIGQNGGVKVNGKEVSQITVGGKTFFMGDNSAALNNLPASVVDKVKVTQKESEASEFSGIKDGDRKTVMDVELKEEYKRGMFGTLMAGGGTTVKGKNETGFIDFKDFLFRTSGMLSAYGEKNQLTAIANGFNVKGLNTYTVIRGDGSSDEKSLDPGGLHTMWQAGANLGSDEIKGMQTTVSAVFNANSGDTRKKSSRKTLVDSGEDVYDESFSRADGDMRSFSTNMEFKKKNTKKFTFKYAPELKLTDFHQTVTGGSESRVLDELKNYGKTSTTENQKTLYTYGKFTAGVKDLGKKRRSITVTGSYSYGNSDGDSQELSTTWYAKDDSSIGRNLFYDNNGENWSYGGSFQYVEPIGKFWAVQGFVSSYYKVRMNNSDAFNEDKTANDYFTSSSENYYWSNYGRILGQFKKDDVYLQFGGIVRGVVNENRSRSYGIDTRTGKDDWTVAVSPFLKFSADMGDDYLYATYDFDSERPSASSIVPAFNIVNPVRITAGNMYLRPSLRHNYSLDLSGSFKKIRMQWYLDLYGEVTKDARVQAIWFDENSVRYSIPVNSRKPSVSNSVSLSLNKSFLKDGGLSLSMWGSLSYDRSVSYQSRGILAGIDIENMDYRNFMSSFWGDNASGNRFYSGESGFSESRTGNLSYTVNAALRYRLDDLTLVGGVLVRGEDISYSFNRQADIHSYEAEYRFDCEYSAPFGFELSSSISYCTMHGYARGYDKPYWGWVMAVNKNVKAFTFSLEGKDLLNQGRTVHHVVGEDYTQESFTNRLGRSLVLSVTWNFGKMNAARSTAARRAMYDMAF